jgi:alanine racemase
MDQCVVNVSHLPEVSVGDEVVLIGKQGSEEISIYEYAEKLGTIVAAIGAMIGRRVPRVYVEEN